MRLRRADRPSSDEREPQRLEVEIVDLGVKTPPASPSPTSVRRVPRRAIIVAATLALAGAAGLVWIVLDDGHDADDAIDVATTEAAPTSSGPADRRAVALASTGGPQMPTIDGITVPTFPRVGNDAPQRSDLFDLLPAIVRFDGDAPRRSTTNVVLGQGGFELDVAILRDPVSDRYQIEIEADGPPERLIVDIETRTMYFSADGEHWFTHTVEPDVDRSDDIPIGEFYGRLLDGPLRADTIFEAEVVATGAVVLDRGRTAAAYRVMLPGAEIPLWRLYQFAPVAEFDPADLPTSLVYDAYVTDDIEVVVGLSAVGNVAQLVQHRIELLPERLSIALPDADQVDDVASSG